MRLDAALTKLERRAKAALRCAWCRYNLIDTPPSLDGSQPDPSDFFKVNCPWCGGEFSVNLTGRTDHQKEAARLSYHKNNGETYRDARVYAASTWFYASLTVEGWRAGKYTLESVQERVSQGRNQNAKPANRYAREPAELRQRSERFVERMVKKEADLYGPYRHDLHAQIEALDDPEDSRILEYWLDVKEKFVQKIAFKVIYAATVMLLCEPVIWGECLPRTRDALAKAELELEGVRESVERRQREIEQRAQEHKEKMEREQAEREQARLERLQAVAPQNSPAPVHAMPESYRAEPIYIPPPAEPSKPRRFAWEGDQEIIEEPKPPRNDGSDPFYHQRMAYYRVHKVWATDAMLGI